MLRHIVKRSQCQKLVKQTLCSSTNLSLHQSTKRTFGMTSLSEIESKKFEFDLKRDLKKPIEMSGIKPDGTTKRFYRQVDVRYLTDDQLIELMKPANKIWAELSNMSTPPPIDVSNNPNRWAVQLGGRSMLTARGHPLTFPTLQLAQAVALEWEAQRERVMYGSMPMLSLSIAAIDRARPMREDYLKRFEGVISVDSLCMHMDDPPKLVKLQTKYWAPLIEWIESTYNIKFEKTSDFGFPEQTEQTKETLRAIVHQCDEWELAALDSLVSLSKSLIFSLGCLAGRVNIDTAYEVARLEENFQMRTYGEIHGIYGHQVEIHYAKMQIAAARNFLNLRRPRPGNEELYKTIQQLSQSQSQETAPSE